MHSHLLRGPSPLVSDSTPFLAVEETLLSWTWYGLKVGLFDDWWNEFAGAIDVHDSGVIYQDLFKLGSIQMRGLISHLSEVDWRDFPELHETFPLEF